MFAVNSNLRFYFLHISGNCHSISKKRCVFSGDLQIVPFFDFFIRAQMLMSQAVCHRSKQMAVGRRNVWRVYESNFSSFTESFDFLLSFEENCGRGSSSALKYVLTVRLLLVEEHVVTGFNASRAVILMLSSGMAVEKRKCLKIPNWKHYLLKTCA